MYLLAIAAFPAACFSSLIAANSFKTTLPKVNPFITVGLGTIAAIILAVTGLAGNATGVFLVIGASFGPVCGAMAADYLLAGRKWAGPRAGFNPAGWISWLVGFAVGAFNLVAGKVPALADLHIEVPVAPVAAFLVGFVLYIVLAKAGLESQKIEHPAVRA
jgi:cytosine permease